MKLKAMIASTLLAGVMMTPVSSAMAELYDDPYENLNRDVFDFNTGVDKALVVPLASGYRTVVPGPYRTGISNALENLSEPQTFLNNLLQGEMKAAGHTLTRFVINSTIGLGGLFDVTTAGDMPRRKEDFGQTLAVWGADSGSYIVLPLFGPSNTRDVAGRVVDTLTDPVNLVAGFTPALARRGVELVDNRSELIEQTDELERTAVDLYATVKALYGQNRSHEIRNGAATNSDDAFPSMGDDEDDDRLRKKLDIRFPLSDE